MATTVRRRKQARRGAGGGGGGWSWPSPADLWRRRRTAVVLAGVATVLLVLLALRSTPSPRDLRAARRAEARAAARREAEASAAGGGDAPAEEEEPPRRQDEAPVERPRILRRFPHDEAAFTQGLELHEGRLLESTGLYGRSCVREVRRETGEVLRETKNRASHFGEGLTVFGGQVIQLTWREGAVVLYEPGDLALSAERKLPEPLKEGWGLAHTESELVASDGSASLHWIDPATFRVTRSVEVRAWLHDKRGVAHLVPVRRLNELEVIDGLVYANIWYSPRIAVIDPASGLVVQWLDLEHAFPDSVRQSREAVLNGIAHDAAAGTLLVTGKLWPELLEVALPLPPPEYRRSEG